MELYHQEHAARARRANGQLYVLLADAGLGEPAFVALPKLVDRRSRSNCGRAQLRGRKAGEPVARKFPAGFRGAHGAVQGSGLRKAGCEPQTLTHSSMKHRPSLFLLVVVAFSFCLNLSAADKLRVLVLTDIENEPDDAMSMVRFLTYCNQWDVEGLVATTSIHQKDKTAAWRIREIVGAYGQVRDNLLIHEPGYPTTNHLLSVLKEGLPDYGMHAVGEGKDSSGSELIIHEVDKDDPRPLWVPVWGGANVLAQALWKVRATRTP